MKYAISILRGEIYMLQWELERIQAIIENDGYSTSDIDIAITTIKRNIKKCEDAIKFLEAGIKTDDLAHKRAELIKKSGEQ